MALILLQNDQSSWPEIIKAVKDPFSLFALIVLVLGMIVIVAMRGQAKWFRVIPLLIVVLALVFLALNATRVINANTTGQAPLTKKDQMQAAVIFKGSHRTTHPTTVPFQTTSGQVNFGCGESAHPSVTFNVPTGGRDINVSAQWANTDNVKGQDQHASVSGNVATAVGTISGFDRDWIGNCRGGGHGELILSGSYVIDQPSSPEPIIKSYTYYVSPGDHVDIGLPTDADEPTKSCEVTVFAGRETYGKVVLAINGDQAVTTEKNGRVDATLLNGKVLLTIQ